MSNKKISQSRKNKLQDLLFNQKLPKYFQINANKNVLKTQLNFLHQTYGSQPTKEEQAIVDMVARQQVYGCSSD